MLIVMAGLPGTGKSALARRLATELQALVLNKDTIRAALFPPSEIEYSTRQDDFCMDVMLRVARYVLDRDPARHVILDGRTFSRRYQVVACTQLGHEVGVPVRIIECVCSEHTARRRLEQDVAEGAHVAANRDYRLYLDVRARFEPIDEPKLVIDTDDSLERCAHLCREYVQYVE